MKVEINHLTKVIQGNVVLDDINACFSCASGENGGRIYGIQGINGVSYRPKLRGQWVPVLRLLAAAALAWVLINALVEAYGVGGCKS